MGAPIEWRVREALLREHGRFEPDASVYPTTATPGGPDSIPVPGTSCLSDLDADRTIDPDTVPRADVNRSLRNPGAVVVAPRQTCLSAVRRSNRAAVRLCECGIAERGPKVVIGNREGQLVRVRPRELRQAAVGVGRSRTAEIDLPGVPERALPALSAPNSHAKGSQQFRNAHAVVWAMLVKKPERVRALIGLWSGINSWCSRLTWAVVPTGEPWRRTASWPSRRKESCEDVPLTPLAWLSGLRRFILGANTMSEVDAP